MSFSELRLVTNKRLGYDMPRVKLKMICTALLDCFQLLSLCASDRIVPDWGGSCQLLLYNAAIASISITYFHT